MVFYYSVPASGNKNAYQAMLNFRQFWWERFGLFHQTNQKTLLTSLPGNVSTSATNTPIGYKHQYHQIWRPIYLHRIIKPCQDFYQVTSCTIIYLQKKRMNTWQHRKFWVMQTNKHTRYLTTFRQCSFLFTSWVVKNLLFCRSAQMMNLNTLSGS